MFNINASYKNVLNIVQVLRNIVVCFTLVYFAKSSYSLTVLHLVEIKRKCYKYTTKLPCNFS